MIFNNNNIGHKIKSDIVISILKLIKDIQANYIHSMVVKCQIHTLVVQILCSLSFTLHINKHIRMIPISNNSRLFSTHLIYTL